MFINVREGTIEWKIGMRRNKECETVRVWSTRENGKSRLNARWEKSQPVCIYIYVNVNVNVYILNSPHVWHRVRLTLYKSIHNILIKHLSKCTSNHIRTHTHIQTHTSVYRYIDIYMPYEQKSMQFSSLCNGFHRRGTLFASFLFHAFDLFSYCVNSVH